MLSSSKVGNKLQTPTRRQLTFDICRSPVVSSIASGGESTAMALIGERWGIFPRLKLWVSEGRPVWGTCAGMILLSDTALMTKQGGQSLVGGLNVEVMSTTF